MRRVSLRQYESAMTVLGWQIADTATERACRRVLDGWMHGCRVARDDLELLAIFA